MGQDCSRGPICKVLPIAPSTYRCHAARRAAPERRSQRAKSDAAVCIEIRRVFDKNFQVYGVRKVWRQLRREGFNVARCTVARLMKEMDLAGAVRGKKPKTTVSDSAKPCPEDRVNREFQAPCPNALWVSDFTYVATWAGFVYVAFVIDVFARMIVGWRVSRTAHAGFVLDALDRALHDRRPIRRGGIIHHADRPRWPPGHRHSVMRMKGLLTFHRAIRLDQLYGTLGRGRDRTFGRQRRRQLRQRPRRDGDRLVQDRGDLPTGAVEELRGRRIRDPRPPPPPGGVLFEDRIAALLLRDGSTGSTIAASSRPSGTSRRQTPKPTIMQALRTRRWRRRTQTNWPPANPARFSVSPRRKAIATGLPVCAS